MRNSMLDDTTVRSTLAIDALDADGTVNGTTVDMRGTANFFRSAMLVVVVGTITDGDHAVILQTSATGSGDWVTAAAEHTAGSIPTIDDAQSNTVHRLAYFGGARYLRASVTSSTVTTGGTLGAVLLVTDGTGAVPIT